MSLEKFVTRRKRRHQEEEKSDSLSEAKPAKVTSISSTQSLGKGKAPKTDHDHGDPRAALDWKKITAENLNLDYVRLYTQREADDILQELEKTIIYNSGQQARVQIFGKWIDIPRKQTAYGEEGLTYTFSGNTVPARPWIALLTRIKDLITSVTGFQFNFVLVNRYKDGSDYMGEHKDDEKDLASDCPIASLSFGQARDFYFKHQDSRGKKARRTVDRVSLVLDHGGLLLMNAPTNKFWYHSLPRRKRQNDVRINLTFRKMNPAMCKPAREVV